MLQEIGIVLLFLLIGGAFNAAEVSMISLRESQVRRLAETGGVRGARLERLVSDPNRFLAAVQIGVTVSTMLSSALGATTISARVSDALVSAGMSAGWAHALSLVGITLILSFLSLVIGELTPKRLALQRRESIALLASGPLTLLARLFRPLVWLLGRSTDGLVRLFRGDPHATGDEISSEELQSLVAAHESLTTVERRMIADVFSAEGTLAREVMVPRREVQFLQASLTVSRAARTAIAHPHSRFPVIGRDVDEVVGVVHIRDLLAPRKDLPRSATLVDIAGPVSVIPGTKGVLDALHEMRAAGQHLAVVMDEYGGTDGIVTLEDLVEEIVGEMVAAPGPQEPAPRAGEVDGLLNLDDFAEATGVELPTGPYSTVAGFVMAGLGRLPVAGDAVEVGGRSLTVTEMDGRRVARIAVGVIGVTEQTDAQQALADRHRDAAAAGPVADRPAGTTAPRPATRPVPPRDAGPPPAGSPAPGVSAGGTSTDGVSADGPSTDTGNDDSGNDGSWVRPGRPGERRQVSGTPVR
ncbi:DUF21 domain-containing protein [Nakamurella sp. YIM 132087]|uniref:DUF21 domain-containing protein n=1 Tax=Nakamurella alba TaxID=2665158 RepID=A0A7K1FJF0_9ACTN|nr:DUF21 domain-containing protein [Nakamurella alba]